jgi:hypothetical protein
MVLGVALFADFFAAFFTAFAGRRFAGAFFFIAVSPPANLPATQTRMQEAPVRAILLHYKNEA